MNPDDEDDREESDDRADFADEWAREENKRREWEWQEGPA